MKVWITKYALTRGILCKDARECTDADMVETIEEWPGYFHGEGRDWHRTIESAVAKAEEMRNKKIHSLRKQIKRLENMKFE